MNTRLQMVAACGLDCGVCELHLCKDNDELKKQLVSMGIPEKDLPCEGCKARRGQCPVLDGTCATYECARKRNVDYCCHCDMFPCAKLAPAADRAGTLPHNLKVHNLCVLEKRGLQALVEESMGIKQTYFRGKMTIGEGPELPAQTP